MGGTNVGTQIIGGWNNSVNNYVLYDEANSYINSTHLNRDIWNDTSQEECEIALTMATRAIDKLAYKGQKATETQLHEFPRGSQTTVPQDIKDACCELAFSFIEGKDPEFEFENLVVLNKRFDAASINFKPEADRRHIAAGIYSIEAWKLLRPYLRDYDAFRLVKV